jgi:hypothetical protein
VSGVKHVTNIFFYDDVNLNLRCRTLLSQDEALQLSPEGSKPVYDVNVIQLQNITSLYIAI